MKGKEPPHSVESESCLLGSMLFDNSCIPKVLSQVDESMFYTDSYRLFFRCIKATYDKLKKVDLVLLKENSDPKEYEAAGGADKSIAIVEGVPNASNWEAYLTTIREKKQLRDILQASEEVVRRIYGTTPSLSECTDLLRSATKRGTSDPAGGLRMDVCARASGESLLRTRTGGVDLRTGWAAIDRDLGGLRRRELTVFGAKMSNCKTSVAMNIAGEMASEGKRVLIDAFENIDQVPTRIASIVSGVPLEYFVKPHLCTDQQFLEAQNALKTVEEFRDHILVLNSASVLDIRSAADEFKPDLIIVDYLQKYGQRYCTGKDGLYAHEIGRVASEVQDLAKDFNAHSLLLSQLSRRMQGERNRPPEVPDLKESGDIENVADNIMLGWWPWRDNPNGGKDPNDYHILIGKNKMGPCESRTLRIDVSTLSIKDYGV